MEILTLKEREVIKENYLSILVHKNNITPYSAYTCGYSSGLIMGILTIKGFNKSNDNNKKYLNLVIDSDFIKWLEMGDQIKSHFLHLKA